MRGHRWSENACGAFNGHVDMWSSAAYLSIMQIYLPSYDASHQICTTRLWNIDITQCQYTGRRQGGVINGTFQLHVQVDSCATPCSDSEHDNQLTKGLSLNRMVTTTVFYNALHYRVMHTRRKCFKDTFGWKKLGFVMKVGMSNSHSSWLAEETSISILISEKYRNTLIFYNLI